MLFSALTDMAALLRDPRWSELAHDTVSHVVIMGGLVEAEDGARYGEMCVGRCGEMWGRYRVVTM